MEPMLYPPFGSSPSSRLGLTCFMQCVKKKPGSAPKKSRNVQILPHTKFQPNRTKDDRDMALTHLRRIDPFWVESSVAVFYGTTCPIELKICKYANICTIHDISQKLYQGLSSGLQSKKMPTALQKKVKNNNLRFCVDFLELQNLSPFKPHVSIQTLDKSSYRIRKSKAFLSSLWQNV